MYHRTNLQNCNRGVEEYDILSYQPFWVIYNLLLRPFSIMNNGMFYIRCPLHRKVDLILHIKLQPLLLYLASLLPHAASSITSTGKPIPRDILSL